MRALWNIYQILTISILTLTIVKSQRRVIGDISEQKISQLADFDAREERVFRYLQGLFNYFQFEKDAS